MATTITYCETDDVRRVLQKSVDFSGNTKPSLEDVKKFILAAENKINGKTQRSWKEVSVSEEYYDIPYITFRRGVGVPVFLKKRFIKTMSTGSGDKIELWDGTAWIDYVTERTEGRADDFWLNYKQGKLFLMQRYFGFREQAIRMTYRYGETTVPEEVKEACAMYAAAVILTSDPQTIVVADPGDGSMIPKDTRVSKLLSAADKLIQNLKDVVIA